MLSMFAYLGLIVIRPSCFSLGCAENEKSRGLKGKRKRDVLRHSASQLPPCCCLLLYEDDEDDERDKDP
jgi:hypothetical protein